MSARAPRHHDDAIRITTAAPSPDAEISARQRRYLLSMLVRTVCFVGAVVTDGWVRWSLVVGAVLLPYLAVVLANAMPGRSDQDALPSAPWGHELPPRPRT